MKLIHTQNNDRYNNVNVQCYLFVTHNVCWINYQHQKINYNIKYLNSLKFYLFTL